MSAHLLPKLAAYAEELIAGANRISAERKIRLRQFADYVRERADNVAALTFVCTHNSRRSQLAQIWAAVAAHYFEMGHVRTCSGGTEVTAFNPRAVAALERAGFSIEDPGGENPHYLIHFAPIAIGGTTPPIRKVTLPPS